MIGWTREVRELADLALARFSGLTESELRLLCAVTTGEIAPCGHWTDDNYNNPDFAELWGPERVIHAGLIHWLCVTPDAAKYIDHRGINVYAARIDGELDLSFASVEFPLHFADCRVTDRVNLRYAQLDNLVMNASVTSGLDGDGLAVSGSINLRDGFSAKGEVRLLGANVGGTLDCRGGKFANQHGPALSADRAKVTGSVFLRNGFSARGAVRLLGADVGGDLDCSGGKFADPVPDPLSAETPGGHALSADGAKVKGSVFLNDGFSAEGEVRLLGADIGRNLDCDRGKFANQNLDALSADGARVNGAVFLRSGFSAEGEVRLLGVDVGTDLDCSGGKFANQHRRALDADRARVKGGVFLRNGFGTDGEIRLSGVDVTGNLEVTGAQFAEGSRVNAVRANVRGGLFWRDMPKTPVALNLSHASVGPIADDRDSWPRQGNLNLDGLVYSRFADNPKDPKDAKSRLEWLGRQPADQFKPQPFQQLAKVLREDGDNVGARRVLVAMENQRRKYGNLKSPTWLWRWILRLTIGYGYRPWYALLWGLLIVTAGSGFSGEDTACAR